MLRFSATTGQTLWGVIYGPALTGTMWKSGSPGAFAAYDSATPVLYAWPFIEQVGVAAVKNAWYTMAVPPGFTAADGAELTIAVFSSATGIPTDAELRGGRDAFSGVWDTTTNTMEDEATWTARRALTQATLAVSVATQALEATKRGQWVAEVALVQGDNPVLLIDETISGQFPEDEEITGMVFSHPQLGHEWLVTGYAGGEITTLGMGHSESLFSVVPAYGAGWVLRRPSPLPVIPPAGYAANPATTVLNGPQGTRSGSEARFKTGDTGPKRLVQLIDRFGNIFPIPAGSTVKCVWRILGDGSGTPKVNQPGEILSNELGLVAYQPLAADTNTAGTFREVWELTVPGAPNNQVLTFPAQGFIPITIENGLN